MTETIQMSVHVAFIFSQLHEVLSSEDFKEPFSLERALVFYLLQKGARFDVRDHHGFLPIQYARDEIVRHMILSR